MEIESLYSGTRWEIIKALSKEALSPIELAEVQGTTAANISQQLRLLELAGLVKSERTSNVEKGKPRIVYSLAEDNAFVILASPSMADKQQMSLSKYHNFILRSWFTGSKENHHLLGELYFKLHDYLDIIKTVVTSGGSGLSVDIAVKDKKHVDAVKKAVTEMKKVSVNVGTEVKNQANSILLYENGGVEQ